MAVQKYVKKKTEKRSSPKSHFLWVTLSFLSVGSNLKIKKHNFNPIKQIFKNWPGIVFLKYSIIEHVIKKSNFMVHIILLFADTFSCPKSTKNAEC